MISQIRKFFVVFVTTSEPTNNFEERVPIGVCNIFQTVSTRTEVVYVPSDQFFRLFTIISKNPKQKS